VYPESTAAHEKWLEEHFDDYGTRLRKALLTGYFFRAVDYVRAQQVRRSLVDEFEEVLSRVDVVATPTTPIVAPRFNETTADAAGASDLLHQYIRMLVLANLTGHPAISVACGRGDDEMPVGLQLIGRAFDDGFVLSVAHAVEEHARAAGTIDLANHAAM
jgi:aspartyl-tRNA(Asn)/glutamyl-tRNA(Gln) amidotransferase subunit A